MKLSFLFAKLIIARMVGTCFEVDGEFLCDYHPSFSGKICETPHCLAEENIPVYPGSNITYSWPLTEAGMSRNQPCPDVCKGLIVYPARAVVVRRCHSVTFEWLDADVTGCGFSIMALKLCEANQVCFLCS